MDRLCLTLRSRFGLQLIPARSIVRKFLSNKNQPSLYLFPADQCPPDVDAKYRFNFLHQQTSWFSGVEKLARATGAFVVYIQILRMGKGRYRAECILISATPELTGETEITQTYTRLLECNIKKQPGGWLWTHKRWKR